MAQTVVVDYGIGNVFSVCNALEAAGSDVKLTRNIIAIKEADRLVLPGVGAFAKAKEALDALDLPEHLFAFAETGRPFLGICVGMQLLMDESHEFGVSKGLGIIPGSVQRIADKTPDGRKMRVPHISWADLKKPEGKKSEPWAHSIFEDAESEKKSVYFVHSYHAKCDNPDHLLAEVDYGGNRITAAVGRDNYLGFQFHPERSGTVGQDILKRFLSL